MNSKQRAIVFFLIFALATLCMGVFTAFLLPWQRYVVALLPFIFSWVGVALVPIFKAGKESFPENTPLN